ncbi:hypothetical protein PACTADRAFT_48575 [Pachysolen tannophilus NRRL Y-2460]|uniref:VWFA domain-containing protein n=1 Tax=Pachysolen tannophilus NRRL Y-2460 TaxID=669874 RepID=A0A1E4TYF2_PACTA|nr:hypothetical protein PACTADRAFT_48575 [Pachysolen tannophilus NRRL Y-2460]
MARNYQEQNDLNAISQGIQNLQFGNPSMVPQRTSSTASSVSGSKKKRPVYVVDSEAVMHQHQRSTSGNVSAGPSPRLIYRSPTPQFNSNTTNIFYNQHFQTATTSTSSTAMAASGPYQPSGNSHGIGSTTMSAASSNQQLPANSNFSLDTIPFQQQQAHQQQQQQQYTGTAGGLGAPFHASPTHPQLRHLQSQVPFSNVHDNSYLAFHQTQSQPTLNRFYSSSSSTQQQYQQQQQQQQIPVLQQQAQQQQHQQQFGSSSSVPITPPPPVPQLPNSAEQLVFPTEVITDIPDTGVNANFQPDNHIQLSSYRNEAAKVWASKPDFRTFQDVAPPPCGVQVPTIVDQGIASPNFMRSSLYSIPSSKELLKVTRLPLGIIFRPFAPAEKEEIPVVDLTEFGGPPRCRRCRTYINPLMQHTPDYKIVCNMCQFASPCPPNYGSSIDVTGKRVDYYQRPELHRGVVDFIVPEEYYVEKDVPPVPMHYVFLIDISESSIALDLPRSSSDAIRQALYGGKESSNLPPNSKIAIITFDRCLHFHNLSPSLQTPSVSTVSDLDDPFIPFYGGFFVDPNESRSIIEDTLSKFESINDYSKIPDPCYGSALRVALDALKSVGGGKVSAILSKLPSWGPGSLKYKDDSNINIVERDKQVLTADENYYKMLAKDYADSGAGLDLFVISNTSVDLSNTAHVTYKTGGNLKVYRNYNVNRDERKFVFEFKASILNDVGYQGQLKVRCSSGLQLHNYYGNYTSKDGQDPILPILNSDQTFMCDFTLDDKLDTKLDAHFQAALLYTDKCGVRKVRVINMVNAVSDRAADVFAMADQDTVLNLWIKQQLIKLPTATLQSIRNLSNLDLVNMLTQYRTVVAAHTSLPNQLVFPETLTCLAMYILGFQKTKLVKSGLRDGDSKVMSWHFLNFWTADKISFYLYPMIVALHSLADEDCMFDDETGHFSMPHHVPAASTSIEYGGCYLAFNGDKIIIFIHEAVNPLLLKDLFGPNINTYSEIDPLLDELPQLDTHISTQVSNLISFITKNYMNLEFAPVQICRKGIDGVEAEFREILVEDRSSDKIYGYSDYLSHIHRSIRDKMDNEKPTKLPESGVTGGVNTLTQRFVHF